MKKQPRTRREIEADIRYEDSRGIHTWHNCKCGMLPRRGKKCLWCLKDELRELEKDDTPMRYM